LQSSFIDDEIRHASLDATMTGLAADEQLAVGRQQRRFRQDLHWCVLVNLDYAGFPPSRCSDMMKDSVIDSLLRLVHNDYL